MRRSQSEESPGTKLFVPFSADASVSRPCLRDGSLVSIVSVCLGRPTVRRLSPEPNQHSRQFFDAASVRCAWERFMFRIPCMCAFFAQCSKGYGASKNLSRLSHEYSSGRSIYVFILPSFTNFISLSSALHLPFLDWSRIICIFLDQWLLFRTMNGWRCFSFRVAGTSTRLLSGPATSTASRDA